MKLLLLHGKLRRSVVEHFRQNNNNGDHVIECNARRGSTTRTSNVTIEGIYNIYIAMSSYIF